MKRLPRATRATTANTPAVPANTSSHRSNVPATSRFVQISRELVVASTFGGRSGIPPDFDNT